jgi:hypothetical protein
MSVASQLSEAWQKKITDLSGQTWFDLPKHMEEALKEENRLATWSIPPEEWNRWVKGNRSQARRTTPVVGIIGLVFAVLLLMLLASVGLELSSWLTWTIQLGLPSWIMFSSWQYAAKLWPDVSSPQEIVIGKTMAIINGEPAVWDYSEKQFKGVNQTVVRAVSLDKNNTPLITIKTKSRLYNQHDSQRGETVRHLAIIKIPVPANKLAEAEQIVRAIDKHATKEFADV